MAEYDIATHVQFSPNLWACCTSKDPECNLDTSQLKYTWTIEA